MKELIKKIALFLKDKNGSEDKGAGIAVAIIGAVVIGLIVINAMTGFFTDRLFPAIFDKIMGGLNVP